MLVIGVGYVYYEFPSGDTWCEHNKPKFNISIQNPKVAYCYREGWDKYCKISYPEYCPNNTYSDHDRCIRSCTTFKAGDKCPCV